jgi:hypothetical protein
MTASDGATTSTTKDLNRHRDELLNALVEEAAIAVGNKSEALRRESGDPQP